MKRFLILLVAIAVGWGTFSYADFAGSGFSTPATTDASKLTSGTLPAVRIADNSVAAAKIIDNSAALIGRFWTGSGDYLKSDGTQGTPAGAGTVTGPATATEDNVATWGGDNTTVKDGGVALSALARLASPTFTGTVTFPTWVMIGTDNVSLNQNLRTTDSPTFAGITSGNFTSNSADNTHYVGVGNTADPEGSNLAAGRIWFNNTSNLGFVRNGDNTATLNIFTATSTNTGNFYTTGTLNGAVKVVAKTDNVTLSGAEMYGAMIEAGAGADNITLAAKVTGMTVCVMATDNVQKRIIPNGSDAIVYMDGTDFGNGHFALSVAAGATAPNGEFLCLIGSATANKWRVTGRGATAWTDGGAP